MSRQNGVISRNPSPVHSFTPGGSGQAYVANIWTGFIIDANASHDLWTFAENDPTVTLARMLTNLKQPARIGSTMDFEAHQLGIRAIKVNANATPPTIQEMSDVLAYIASLKLNFTLGDNQTRIAEFSGAHLLNVVNFAGETTGAAGALGATPFNSTAWINLPEPIAFESDLTIGGNSTCNLASVPTSLTTSPAQWAIMFILAGFKQAKT